MNIIVVGLSHKTATVEIREKVAFSPNQIEKPLSELIKLEGIIEGVIVSTCNRVEIYATTRDIAGGIARIKRFMAEYHHLPFEALEPHLYSYHAEVRHPPCIPGCFQPGFDDRRRTADSGADQNLLRLCR